MPMNGFYMTDCRTRSMSPSEIKDMMHAKTLSLCPYQNLSPGDTDEILDGFLYRTKSPDPETRRCMWILSLGTNHTGVPVASIQTNCSDGRVLRSTPAVCTYCPQFDNGCDSAVKFDIYEILQDDPEFNKAVLERMLDDD